MKPTLLLSLAIACSACTPEIEPDDGGAHARSAVVEQEPAAARGSVPAVPQVPARSLHYQCGDLLVSVQMQADAMELSFSGRGLALRRVPADSGARYDDGKGNAFWRKGEGEETLLTLDGAEAARCTPSERASPWVDAQARGIAFRAVGSEPGWYVEVGRGEAPPLHALLDYGERRIDVVGAASLTGDIAGFRGTATDGTAIELRITRTPCNDGMSGEAFEASAELLVADKPYRGCGAYLR